MFLCMHPRSSYARVERRTFFLKPQRGGPNQHTLARIPCSQPDLTVLSHVVNIRRSSVHDMDS